MSSIEEIRAGYYCGKEHNCHHNPFTAIRAALAGEDDGGN